jgi:hypothetical protein
VNEEVEPIAPAFFRAPAAVIAGAYVVGLVVGESAKPLSADPLSFAFWVATALVLAPFALPLRWFGRSPRLLGAWMLAAAIVVTARAAFMAGWLFPRLPMANWLMKLTLDLVLVGALWVATVAVRRTPDLGRRSSDPRASSAQAQ